MTTTKQDYSSGGIGIIFPPADVRAVVDKTAAFVAKNGEEFEQKVLREQSGPKFAFLYPGNPYRAYYDMRVREIKSGQTEASKPAVPLAIQDMRRKEETRKRKKQQALALTQYGENDGEIRAPDQDQFSVHAPNATALDLDVMKLTAQFVARNGQKFLLGLTQRERGNPQFDFLQPSHSYFHYFTNMVDIYTRCMNLGKRVGEQLAQTKTDRGMLIQRCANRKKWNVEREREKNEKETKEDEERAQFASIDWHDFVVVQVIEFTEQDETNDLPPPVDLTAVSEPVPLTERHTTAAPPEPVAPPPVEVEAPTDSPEVEPPRPVVPQIVEEGDIVIRKDYQRVRKRGPGGRYQKCPITGQMVPVDVMSEHLKIVLLDPQWKMQRDRLLEKAKKESAFAPEEDVDSNLINFVQKRPDLFGSIEDEVQDHIVDATPQAPKPNIQHTPMRIMARPPPLMGFPPPMGLRAPILRPGMGMGMPPQGMGMPGMGMGGMPHPGMGMGGMPPQGMPGMPPQGMGGMPPQGMPGMPPQGMPGMPPQGMPGMPPQGMPGMPPQGMPGMPPQGMPGMPPHMPGIGGEGHPIGMPPGSIVAEPQQPGQQQPKRPKTDGAT